MNGTAFEMENDANESGGGMLTVVAVLGLLLMLVQGTVYYRAKAGARFLSGEKNKVLAMQLAEAGVEENIADLARRATRIRSGLADSITYDHKVLEGGNYTSTLTAVGLGAEADTVDLVSTGTVSMRSQTVQARLGLKKFLDTTITPSMTVAPETTATITTATVPVTHTDTIPPPDPLSAPSITSTAEYAACMADGSLTKCNVCHFGVSGDLSTLMNMNLSKGLIATHKSHVGDYVNPPPGTTCDRYNPTYTTTTTMEAVSDTALTIADKTIYDTTVVIDTAVKVQILSWK